MPDCATLLWWPTSITMYIRPRHYRCANEAVGARPRALLSARMARSLADIAARRVDTTTTTVNPLDKPPTWSTGLATTYQTVEARLS